MSTPTAPKVDLGAVLPARVRQVVYLVFVLALVVGFALDLAIEVNPGWLVSTLRTLDGLSPLVLMMAALNVPTGDVVSGSDATVVLGTSHAEREAAAGRGDL